ncbi:SRPBCC family protein [Oceanobacillus sojae]|uniref:SRPBCC family protein n=1 Tax=Oceanobacillus sojae TaxID=582851 RepID=UPI0021A4D117|nr:SRPBCC family protein [Oceanobacillus sojae]MCT1902204.1 SRPBCC family protein [Oceanobacillus sojae]
MLKADYSVNIDLPQSEVWSYLEDWSHWAKQVPGYQTHKKVSAADSVWELHGKVGTITKDLKLYVRILETVSPSIVQFRIRDSENRCLGNGCFKLSGLSSRSSELTCLLELELKGLTGKISAPLIGSLLPTVLEKFVQRIIKPLKETDSVALSL